MSNKMSSEGWQTLPAKRVPEDIYILCDQCEGRGVSQSVYLLPCTECRGVGWKIDSNVTTLILLKSEQEALNFCLYYGITIESAGRFQTDKDAITLRYRGFKLDLIIRGFAFLTTVNELVAILKTLTPTEEK